jgi:hypothetical protein
MCGGRRCGEVEVEADGGVVAVVEDEAWRKEARQGGGVGGGRRGEAVVQEEATCQQALSV